MSIYTKRILFSAAGVVIAGTVGYLEPNVLHLLGLFAIGWMLSDISQAVFPEKR